MRKILLLISAIAFYQFTIGQNINNVSISSEKNLQDSVKIHVIIFANNTDDSIKNACQKDRENIINMVQGAKKYTNVQIKLYNEQNEFTLSALNRIIDSLSVNKNDVIIFCYFGHGFRFQNQSNDIRRFPYLSISSDSKKNKNLEDIHNTLKQKKPRLLLTIGNLCNSIVPYDEDTWSNKSLVLFSSYEKLFIKAKGDLLVTSSKPGQYSYVVNRTNSGKQLGGIFTNAFIESFQENVKTTDKCSWNDILEDSRLKCINSTTLNYWGHKQEPIFICNISY